MDINFILKSIEQLLKSDLIMEKVLLVKLFKDNKEEYYSDLEEMKGLIKTAGGVVYDVVLQKRNEITPSFYIGKGKTYEIAEKYKDKIDLVVFDAELKPVQVRNLEKIINKRIIDRTQLILDIFAQRAHTKEGKLQVEYAQLNYLLPRLTGRGVELSQLGGGIGTRGPGETKLETDRRRIKNRIQKIKKELEKIKSIRDLQRKKRKDIPVPQIAIVGYTNAGKTMLLNKLTDAGMLSEDKLFATLDPKIKQYILPDGYKVLFSDTVGFIKNLPTTLIAAFRATLEEVKEADIILHIIDINNPDYLKQKEVVYQVLKEIDAYENKKIIEVYNKIDLLSKDAKNLICGKLSGFFISAKTGQGIDKMIMHIKDLVEKEFVEKEIKIPYDKKNIISLLFNETIVKKIEEKETYVYLKIKCLKKTYEKFLSFLKS